MVSGPKRKSIVDRFYKLVDKTSICWNWIGSKYKNGYGSFGVGIWREGTFKNAYAHRISFELHNGPIPPGLCVLHKCDNRGCVNPSHLFLGTQAENIRDMVMKKRHDFGEKNAMAKLKESDIHEIRKLSHEGMTQKEIASHFPVKEDAIGAIIRGENWKHI